MQTYLRRKTIWIVVTIQRAGIAGVSQLAWHLLCDAQAAIRWRLASSFPKSLDTIYGGADVFRQRQSKPCRVASLKFRCMRAAKPMPVRVLDGGKAARSRCATVPYYFYGKNPALPGFGHSLASTRQMDAWMMHGNGRKLMNEFYANFNAISFCRQQYLVP